MKRLLYRKLLEWKDSPARKPLMLYGARQVGKTYLLKHFGEEEFENMVYVNCYKNAAVATLFAQDKDIDRILLGLSALTGERIEPGRTFVFLDEVQDIPDVVASLKYFCEDRRALHVAAAGSMLGVMNMEGISYPTGKVAIMTLYPMDFIEFLYALGEDIKARLLETMADWSVIESLHTTYVELLRQYYFVGGMPEAVLDFITHRTPASVRKIQQDILTAYDADIAKHAGAETVKVRMVFESLPAQLARENKKFIFGAVRKGARTAEFENAIQWLVDAGLVYKVERVAKAAIPLKFYFDRDAFKLFLLDVGLLGAMSQTPPGMMLVGDNVFEEFKGAFTENYVLTQIKSAGDIVAAFYSKPGSTLEIDFIVQAGESLLPIEVKAEKNVKSKSLRQFVTVDNAGTSMHGYRFSMLPYRRQEWMTNVPLFAVGPWLETESRRGSL